MKLLTISSGPNFRPVICSCVEYQTIFREVLPINDEGDAMALFSPVGCIASGRSRNRSLIPRCLSQRSKSDDLFGKQVIVAARKPAQIQRWDPLEPRNALVFCSKIKCEHGCFLFIALCSKISRLQENDPPYRVSFDVIGTWVKKISKT